MTDSMPSAYTVVGPIEESVLLIDGRRIPFLAAHLLPGGKVLLSLDDRFALELTVADAERVVPFIADCIAVSLGYTSHPRGGAEPRARSPFPSWTEIDLPKETP